jgi:hypothetical protein
MGELSSPPARARQPWLSLISNPVFLCPQQPNLLLLELSDLSSNMVGFYRPKAGPVARRAGLPSWARERDCLLIWKKVS